MRHGIVAIAALTIAVSTFALAHGENEHAAKAFDPGRVEQKDFGRAGDPKAVTRTMTVRMSDKMQYTPAVLSLRQGETVRFVVRNEGKTLHEMVLGTPDEIRKHAEMMRQFPDMEHDEPHMVHVEAGHTGNMVWTFNRPGEFQFACLVPGHYEAGMVGRIIVK